MKVTKGPDSIARFVDGIAGDASAAKVTLVKLFKKRRFGQILNLPSSRNLNMKATTTTTTTTTMMTTTTTMMTATMTATTTTATQSS